MKKAVMHRIEEVILVLIILLQILDFFEILPADLDYAKKIISWTALGYLLLTSVLQTAYLFRLINYMYARKPADTTKIKEPMKLIIPIFILVGALILLGLYPQIVFNLIDPVIKQWGLLYPIG